MNFNFDKTLSDININIKNNTVCLGNIGENHNGDIKIVKSLIDMAAKSGLDMVKISKSSNLDIYSQEKLSEKDVNFLGDNYEKHKEKLEFNIEQLKEIKDYCNKKNILLCISCLDLDSVDLMNQLNIDCFYLESFILTDLELVEYTAKKNKPLLISSGMCDFNFINEIYNLVLKYNKNICILQHTSSYPLKLENINLNIIKDYQIEFPDAIIGYSGFNEDLSVCIGAFSIGAKIIEKPITLNKNMKGLYHKYSLNEEELCLFVNSIRNIEKAMGSYVKIKLDCEEKFYLDNSRSIYLKNNLNKNDIIKKEDLICRSPNLGISPIEIENIIGKKVLIDINKNTLLLEEYLE